MKKVLIALVFQIHLNNVCAQVVSQDSRGKDVLEVYKAESFTGSFSPGQLSLSLNYNFIIGKPFEFTSKGNSTVTTARAIGVTVKVTGSGTEAGKPFDLKQELVRPAVKLEIGYHRTIEEFNDINSIPGLTYSTGGTIFSEWQNILTYDTISKVFKEHKPFLLGAHGYLNVFHKKGYFALSISQDISNAYNKDILSPYQSREGVYIDDNIISQTSFKGYIGNFEREISYRTRLAVPIFINKYINLNPYCNWFGYLSKNPKKIAGMAVNFLNGSPRESNGRIGKGFGAGIDWLKTGGSWSKPNYFIFGSLDLKFLKKLPQPLATEDKFL